MPNTLLRDFCDAIEHFAQTGKGRELLDQCGIGRLLVWGSGTWVLSEEPRLFTREAADLDMRVITRTGCRFNKARADVLLPRFFEQALEATDIGISSAKPKGDSLLRKAQHQLLPKQYFLLTRGDVSLPMDVSCHDTHTQLPVEDFRGRPLAEDDPQLLCLEHACERLANKLMALHNTHRQQNPDKPYKQAHDVLDVINLRHVLHSRGVSDEAIEEGVRDVSGKDPRKQFMRRQKLHSLHNITQGKLFGEICHNLDTERLASQIDDIRASLTPEADNLLPESKEMVEQAYRLAHVQSHRISDVIFKAKNAVPSGHTR